MFRPLFFVFSAILLILAARAEEVGEENVNNISDDIASLEAAAMKGGVQAMHDYAQALAEEGRHFEQRMWLRRAAERGHLDSAYQLGHIYETGIMIREDHVEAIRWFRFAAERGHVDSFARYGMMLEEGKGTRVDKDGAVKWFIRGADAGDNFCMYAVADDKRTSDPAMSFKYAKMGAEKGEHDCMLILARHCLDGKVTKADPFEACVWTVIASRLDSESHVKAMLLAGETDPSMHQAALTEAANRMARLGLKISDERRKELDAEAAMTAKAQKDAESGDHAKVLLFAQRLQFGTGCLPDLKRAYGLIRKTAEAGSMDGIGMVATCHLFGTGVPKDRAEGLRWMERAYKAGSMSAALLLSELHLKGEDGDRNEALSLSWLMKAASGGLGPAQTRLAAHFESKEDFVNMVIWLKAAVRSGEAAALMGLHIAYRYGKGVKTDRTEAAAYAIAILNNEEIEDRGLRMHLAEFMNGIPDEMQDAAHARAEIISTQELAVAQR